MVLIVRAAHILCLDQKLRNPSSPLLVQCLSERGFLPRYPSSLCVTIGSQVHKSAPAKNIHWALLFATSTRMRLLLNLILFMLCTPEGVSSLCFASDFSCKYNCLALSAGPTSARTRPSSPSEPDQSELAEVSSSEFLAVKCSTSLPAFQTF